MVKTQHDEFLKLVQETGELLKWYAKKDHWEFNKQGKCTLKFVPECGGPGKERPYTPAKKVLDKWEKLFRE